MKNKLGLIFSRLLYKAFSFLAITHGMLMFKNDYIYVDYYGRLWRLRATGRPEYPFTIELMEQ